MSMVTLSLPISYPGSDDWRPEGLPSLTTSTTIDAAGEYHALIFTAEQAMTISHVGFSLSTASGSPTADVRIETVAADGTPSGTLFGTNTNLVTGTLSSGFTLHALTASATINKGDKFAVKVLYNSGTSMVIRVISPPTTGYNLPYKVTNTGAPSKAIYNECMPMVLGSGASSFYCMRGTLPITAISQINFNNSVAGTQRGLRFKVPFACRISGFSMWCTTAVGDYNAKLLDDGGSELSSSSTAYDGDTTGANSAGNLWVAFDNAVSLSKDTWYRLVIEPSSATNCTIAVLTMVSATYIAATPWGSNAHYTTFTTAGGWVDSATDQLPFISLLLDQIDDGTGSGGASTGHVIGE